MCVCRVSGFYGSPFKTLRGATQGGPDSPRLFNVIVNAVVREWLRQLLGAEAAQLGCGEDVQRFLSLFYADDGVVATRCEEMHGRAVTLLVSLFERAGL